MPNQASSDKGISRGEHQLHRVEHYALYIINGMAAGGSGSLTDADIDYAIDAAERLASKLVERGHIPSGG